MKNTRAIKYAAVLVILLAVLACACLLSLCAGSADIPFRDIPGLLFGGGESIQRNILMDIRLPRLILGILIGGALSLAGALLQGMFRNPLVEPYTLGISGGASLGICLNILFKWDHVLGVIAYPLAGFAGAAAVVLAVYFLSLNAGSLKTNHMLLTGVMISFVSSSLIMLIMAIARSDDIHTIVLWTMGSLDVPNMKLVKIAAAGILAGLVASLFFCLDLNALALGEEEAASLGVNVDRTKKWLFVLASLLTGLSVSVAGIIGFVGLIVPHLMRLVIGPDHRLLLIGSFLAGASFLVLCDIAARTVIAPLELPVGVITGIIGGTVFIYALGKRQVTL
ncbi:MAG: iron ABC transporter permease [Thermodesulfobacteriota bacterium]